MTNATKPDAFDARAASKLICVDQLIAALKAERREVFQAIIEALKDAMELVSDDQDDAE